MSIKKFIHEETLKMSDDALRDKGLCKIGILYGSNNYGCSLAHINVIKEEILKDYPETKDEDIEIWHINENESIRHAKFTMLNVSIPLEDFIKFRAANLIHIL